MTPMPPFEKYQKLTVPVPDGCSGPSEYQALFWEKTSRDRAKLIFEGRGESNQLLINEFNWNGEHFELIDDGNYGYMAQSISGLDVKRCEHELESLST